MLMPILLSRGMGFDLVWKAVSGTTIRCVWAKLGLGMTSNAIPWRSLPVLVFEAPILSSLNPKP